MVSVTVKLYGTLSRFLLRGEGSLRMDLPAPATAGALLGELGVPIDVLDVLFLNGQVSSPETLLSEGDLLEAFPFLGGGEARTEC